MIRASGLTAGYSRSAPVLDGIDLSVREGELLGIMGPNGSGKTTLLRCLYGSIQPFEGVVELDGCDIGAIPARDVARRIAVVPQETEPGFDFKVGEVVTMGRYPWMGVWRNGRNGHSAAVTEALERAGILQLRERQMSELSGGERRLVYLARSLAQSTQALLLDEPTRGLDVRHALSIMRTLGRLGRGEGLAVAAVLHDLDTALRFCDRAILLKEGKVVSMGVPEDVLSPENIRTAFGVSSSIHRLEGGMHLEVLG
ncbi:MAG: ABC transporter ATP-binding protein [Candidatus Thermoplasmatota archaeon]|jgi:iron complex transport system ATP-binding protein|nr:ABC transporter ATP-binding protein [Candidatus Thermoplasmatota archaeon]